MTTLAERRAPAGWLAIASIVAVLVLHAKTLWIGLQPDAIVTLRPWTLTELKGAFAGQWLFPTVDYYHRPLATTIFAADFSVFGLNSRALHAESLALLAGVCWLLGWWLWLEAGSVVAIASMALYLTHPELLDSSIAGVQYHFHLVPTLIVVATLRLWTLRRRNMSLRAWWPLLLLPVVGFYVKEDTIMLLPAILALQALRARITQDVPAPSRVMMVTTASIMAGLALIRWWIFPHFETVQGFFERGVAESLLIAVYAPARTAFGMFARHELLWGPTLFVLLLQAAGARQAWRKPASPSGWAWICGCVLLIAFCLPLTITNEIRSTRVHLAVLSAAIMFGAGAAAFLQALSANRKLWRRLAIVVIVIGVVAQARSQAETLAIRFAPCSAEQLDANGYAMMWPEITPDLRDWLAGTRANCESSGAASPEDGLTSVRWSSPTRHVVLVNQHASSVTLAFAPVTADVAILVSVDGQSQTVNVGPDRTAVRLSLTPSWRTWLRREFRLDVGDGSPLPALVSVEIK